MASSFSEAIVPPAPPPPPPLINNDNTTTNTVPNGPTTSQVQAAGNGPPTTATDGTKSWQRAWSVDEMRKGATNWSLASDAGLLLYMQEFSQNMLSQTHSMEQKVDGLVHETKGMSAKVHNTFNNFLMLSNTQFIENRVYDEEETKDEEEKQAETAAQEKEKTREELETEVIPKINEALQSGLAVLDSAFVTVEITPEQVSDDEDEGTLPENLKPEPILELTDIYAYRKLPSFIGTAEFQKDDLVGLGESSSEDEASDKEASMESEEEKSTEDDETSESETVSGSQSESEESSTATESEDEKDVVVKKKARKESEQSDSDEGLFAAGGTEKSAKSKQTGDDDEDDSDESEEEQGENEEQPRKPGAPMDFSAELAAKLGVKAKQPLHDSDEEGDNEEDWGESERHGSEASKEDLFAASIDTTTSVSSKDSKRKNKKHKKPKSRSSSHASHDSAAVAAGNATNELETSQRQDEDEDDSLFTSSIDTTSSTVSKGSRSKHKHHHHHKKKTARSDSQLSNASSKSAQKDKKTTSNKKDDNLFGGSPEGDLFDEDTSSPFTKKGGMFSGGGGLFDDVMEEEVSKPDAVDSISKSSHEQDKSDEEIVKRKPRTLTSSSGKKLPAGAVAIFGDHDPFAHAPAQTSEHPVAKSGSLEKKESKPSGGGLFSDEGEDIFTSSQTSSIVSSKPPVATKATKSVDLFGSGDDEDDDDDDSLFGAKPARKTEPKAEPPKKKIPAGAVSMFGSALPPPLFNAPNKEPPEPVVVPPASTKPNVKTTKESSVLFDEDDDKTSSFNSERSAVTSTAAPVAPAVKAKRKTNQISLFDDNEDEEEEDAGDLFASIAPSKTIGSTKTDTVSKPVQATNTKTPEVSKPAPKRSTISLFDDDDEEEDEEEDIFSIKPSTMGKPPEVKPSGKSSTPSPGLFASQEDPLFSGSKPKVIEKPDEVDSVDNKIDVKTTKQESAVLHVDEDDEKDLFAEPKPKDIAAPAVTQPPKKEEDKQSEELFDADGDLAAKDEQDGVKNTPGRKILPGAVPMFGGVDIFAGQKPAKTTKAKPQGDSLFANDEDDLFAAIPKPAPTLAPRAKPRKPPVEVRQPTASSPLEETKVPEQSPPGVSSSNKNTNVGKLQKTLAFNPAAMLPGAAPPPKRQEATAEPVRGKKPIIFNPATMLPGAVPPPRKQEVSAEATFDKPASGKILDSSGRDRARVRGKRRPPTRQARQKAAKESMDDTSLFGSDLTVSSSSHEGLSGTRAGQTSLFSDSEDLFSSSRSYEPPKKYNQKSAHATQSHASKFDPLFIHNTTASALPSFEDSIDGISTDQTSTKNNVSNINTAQSDTTKTDPLFHNPLKNDLFSTSTESESSFLPKSNVVGNRVANNEEGNAQPSKSLFCEKPKDDLFSLSTESESSILQKSEVIEDNVPKAGQTTTNTKSLFDKKSKDDLFSQSTESEKSQKAKPKEDFSATKNQKSKTDSLFVSKPKDDLFSQSVESNKASPQNVQVIEDDDEEDEDDLFKSNSRPLFFPPPLDFDGEVSERKSKPVSDDIFGDDDIFAPKPSKKKDSDNKTEKNLDNEVTETKSKPVKDDIFGDDIFAPKSSKNKDGDNKTEKDLDNEVTETKPKPVKDDDIFGDDDIFAQKPSRKKDNENNREKKETKLDKKKDPVEVEQEKPKASEVKKTSAVDDDLFADTGSIFDDLPKKSKEKKKKKATTSKEENIFDETKDSAASEEASTSKTTKKTKGKKKGKSKISIFDEDSPSIFDDPLNATSK